MRNNAYSSENTACFALKKRVARVRAATPEIGVFFCRVTPGVTPVLTPGDPPGISNWRFLAGHQGSGQGSHQGSPGRRKPLFRGWQPGRAPPFFSKRNKQYSPRNTHCFASFIFMKHENKQYSSRNTHWKQLFTF